MEKTAPDEQVTDLSLVGFEKMFVQVEQRTNNEQTSDSVNIPEQVHELDAESAELVTMAEASRRLKMPYPTLRRHVLSGKIPSTAGSDGKPLVKLLSNEQSSTANEQSIGPTEQSTNKAEQSPAASEYSVTIQRLFEQMEAERSYSRTLNEKLEAATYRNGYLEAQLSGAQEQLKLLPDLSAKATRTENLEDKIANLESELEAAKRSWWAKFGTWFMGK